MTTVDSPKLTAAKRLIDAAKVQGFAFQRIAPGPDGPCSASGISPSIRTGSTSAGSLTVSLAWRESRNKTD
jgi:hypothetical protein